MKRLITALCAASCLALPAAAQQQMADPDFKPAVARPAFRGQGPVVLIDEAHQNFHTAEGRYAPFARLLRADGFDVRPGRQRITEAALAGAKVLVVANAGLPASDTQPVVEAFSGDERQALRRWVEGGGALLLIADHAPFGQAVEQLGEAFGVEMGKGYVFEPAPGGEPNKLAYTTQLEFSRGAGRLGEHAITRGLNAGESIRSVRSFTGQSLSVPPGATNLLRLRDEAREPPAPDLDPTQAPRAKASQGIAMKVGKGRVVVLGEAAMLSAQVVRFPDGREPFRMGMNVPGYDNTQFALNLMRWLAGALP